MSAVAFEVTRELCPSSEIPNDVTLRLLSGRFSREDYRVYLCCDHWKAVKVQAFRIHGQLCVLCDKQATEVHHRPSGYQRLFREDPSRHLIPLCRGCHARHHGK